MVRASSVQHNAHIAKWLAAAFLLLQVLRLEDYGALLSIYNSSGKPSGVQGLLHKSELSWDLVMAVEDIVKAGEDGSSSAAGLGV
jgi:ribosomal protein S1